MPTQNRKDFIRTKVRGEFRKSRGLTDTSKIQEQVLFASDSLENVAIQRKHLCEVSHPFYSSFNHFYLFAYLLIVCCLLFTLLLLSCVFGPCLHSGVFC
jgi:hypothetical protein